MSQSRKILLIDDADASDIKNVLLANANHKLIAVASGQEAIRTALREQPDLVVLTARLPDLAPAEVVSRIRNMPGLRAVPVILLANGSDDPALLHCLKMGLSDYVTRPVDASQLLRKTAKALGLAERKNVSFLVRVDREGASNFARAADLSSSGIRIESTLDLSPGDTVGLQFFVPGSRMRIQVSATVVRRARPTASSDKGYGLRFVDLQESARELIAKSMQPR